MPKHIRNDTSGEQVPQSKRRKKSGNVEDGVVKGSRASTSKGSGHAGHDTPAAEALPVGRPPGRAPTQDSDPSGDDRGDPEPEDSKPKHSGPGDDNDDNNDGGSASRGDDVAAPTAGNPPSSQAHTDSPAAGSKQRVSTQPPSQVLRAIARIIRNGSLPCTEAPKVFRFLADDLEASISHRPKDTEADLSKRNSAALYRALADLPAALPSPSPSPSRENGHGAGSRVAATLESLAVRLDGSGAAKAKAKAQANAKAKAKAKANAKAKAKAKANAKVKAMAEAKAEAKANAKAKAKAKANPDPKAKVVEPATAQLFPQLLQTHTWVIATPQLILRARRRSTYKQLAAAAAATAAAGGSGGLDLGAFFLTVLHLVRTAEERAAKMEAKRVVANEVAPQSGDSRRCRGKEPVAVSGEQAGTGPAPNGTAPGALEGPLGGRRPTAQRRGQQPARKSSRSGKGRRARADLLPAPLTVQDARRAYPVGCLLLGPFRHSAPVALHTVHSPGGPTGPTGPAVLQLRFRGVPPGPVGGALDGTWGRAAPRLAAAAAAAGVALWSAYLPAAALTVPYSVADWAAVAGALPSGAPLRVCRTPAEAAEAVDLALLALRGPFGTPLNGSLGTYAAADIGLLFPARGSELLERIAAIRHSLAGPACHVAQSSYVGGKSSPQSPGAGGGGVVRVRFGCRQCAPCRDPLARAPCLRPLTPLAADVPAAAAAVWHSAYRRALREALGWDPAAANAVAADFAVGRKRPASCVVVQEEEDEEEEEELEDEEEEELEEEEEGLRPGGPEGRGSGMAAAAGAPARTRPTRRRRLGERRHDRSGDMAVDTSGPGRAEVQEAEAAAEPLTSDDELPLQLRIPHSARRGRRRSSPRGRGDVRRRRRQRRRQQADPANPYLAAFRRGAADGDVIADPGGEPDEEAYDGMAVDGDRRPPRFSTSLGFLRVALVGARREELAWGEEEELRAALVGVLHGPVRLGRGGGGLGRGQNAHQTFGSERLVRNYNAPSAAAGGRGQRLPGWVGLQGPTLRRERALLGKLGLDQPQAWVQRAAVVKAAGLDLVALPAPPQTCPWCGLYGHTNRLHCPLRRLCEPPMEPVIFLQQQRQQRRQPPPQRQLYDVPGESRRGRQPLGPGTAAAAVAAATTSGRLMCKAPLLLPQHQLLPPGPPRASHHYSTLLGGGPLEPQAAPAGVRWWRVTNRTRGGSQARGAQGVMQDEGGVEGSLPSLMCPFHFPDTPSWWGNVPQATLGLMSALQAAQPWASGLQPVRCVGTPADADGPDSASKEPGESLGADADARGSAGAAGSAGAETPANAGAAGNAGAPPNSRRGAVGGVEDIAGAAAAATGVALAAKWGVLASPQPLGFEELLMLALLVEESIKLELETAEAVQAGRGRGPHVDV